ncbi:RNA 2'-phosphotransferase [Ruegeria lacuscaerulensis]|uniref:RNA 2'-phosphotransferase n=1 Tax=Ruegeria lacuscaerulensis TaxID=55218 RepID=UPI00147ED466|nr:RNA 2'-phosphotransferase [Ruegeria lacuscaerulensis]
MSKESKFLARVLRHQPELIGLKLGVGGWVLIDDLLRGMKRAGHRLSWEDLERIVQDNDKRRFTLSDDGKRIRAAQGHSVEVDLLLEPQEPPAELFHGTAKANLDSIWSDGIKAGRRQQVHLSSDPETATRVGQRHGRPVVLKVAADAMYEDGHLFWRADNGVWLTDYVPPQYLGF